MNLFTVCFGTQYTAAEATIAAKYDLLIVNQATSAVARAWYDSIRALNPAIKLLAYLITNHEPGTALGVGNDILRDANRWTAGQQEPWLLTADGNLVAITIDTWKSRRLYDYRKAIWQTNFRDACAAILSAYPFDGLFFDNCTASWTKQSPNNAALATSLQSTLLDVRRAYPSKLFLGNCTENWLGLNGEMNEGRATQLLELAPVVGQVVPNLNCYLALTTPTTPDSELAALVAAIAPTGAWFGVQRSDNVLYWPPIFDSLEA